MKSTILLTTALFLASAPSPDSKTVSEISAGFLSPASDQGLMAAGPATGLQDEPGFSGNQLSANEVHVLDNGENRQTEASDKPAQEQPQTNCITSQQNC